MISTLANQFLAENAGRRYPLADNTTGISDASILDFTCTLYDKPDCAAVFATLSAIETKTIDGATYKRLTVVLSFGACTLIFDIPTNIANTAYTATQSQASIGNVEGRITVTPKIITEEDDQYNIPFAKTVVTVDPLRVDSLVADGSVDPSAQTAPISGDIILTHGYNTDPYLDENRLRLDIFKGAGIGEWCPTRAPEAQRCDTILFTINGERPGSDGDIKIVGESGITVTPIPEEHAIEIKLSQPAIDKIATACEATC